MNILEDFYERLLSITEEKKLSHRKLKKCYTLYKESIEIGELYVERYKYENVNVDESVMKYINEGERIYIHPATELIFKRYECHPLYNSIMYVCIGVLKSDEIQMLTMTEALICQNNKWFFNIDSCKGSSSEIPEDFYSIKL